MSLWTGRYENIDIWRQNEADKVWLNIIVEALRCFHVRPDCQTDISTQRHLGLVRRLQRDITWYPQFQMGMLSHVGGLKPLASDCCCNGEQLQFVYTYMTMASSAKQMASARLPQHCTDCQPISRYNHNYRLNHCPSESPDGFDSIESFDLWCNSTPPMQRL